MWRRSSARWAGTVLRRRRGHPPGAVSARTPPSIGQDPPHGRHRLRRRPPPPRPPGAGHDVRCLVRDPARAELPDGVEVVRGDVLRRRRARGRWPAPTSPTTSSTRWAAAASDFAEKDRRAADAFGGRRPRPASGGSSTSAAWRAAGESPSTCAAGRRSPRSCAPRPRARPRPRRDGHRRALRVVHDAARISSIACRS